MRDYICADCGSSCVDSYAGKCLDCYSRRLKRVDGGCACSVCHGVSDPPGGIL